MTGEITLRGDVLPVGGIKEKVLAARRARVQTIILPAHNERDLEDISKELRRDMQFVFVSKVHEVFEHAIIPGRGAKKKTVGKKSPTRKRKR